MKRGEWVLAEDVMPSENDAAWLVTYYSTVIEDIARTKKRQMESLYYSMLLYVALFEIDDYFLKDFGTTPKIAVLVVFAVSVLIYVSTLVLINRYEEDLHYFRAIARRFHTRIFPAIVRSVRYGISIEAAHGTADKMPERNKPKQDLPINLLMRIVPLSGPVFLGSIAWQQLVI